MLYISIAIETRLNRESQLKKEWEPAMQRRREIWAPYPPPHSVSIASPLRLALTIGTMPTITWNHGTQPTSRGGCDCPNYPAHLTSCIQMIIWSPRSLEHILRRFRRLKQSGLHDTSLELNFYFHVKKNFVSPSDHVIFFLLYKHQWNAKPFYVKRFLVWKVRFIVKP